MSFNFGDNLSPADRITLAGAFERLAATEEWQYFIRLLEDFRTSAAFMALEDTPERHLWWQGYLEAVRNIAAAPQRIVGHGRIVAEQERAKR